MLALQSIKESMIKPQWSHLLEKFIKSQVWRTSDQRRGSAQDNKLWKRLESRLIELKERRKRITDQPLIQDSLLQSFEHSFDVPPS